MYSSPLYTGIPILTLGVNFCPSSTWFIFDFLKDASGCGLASRISPVEYVPDASQHLGADSRCQCGRCTKCKSSSYQEEDEPAPTILIAYRLKLSCEQHDSYGSTQRQKDIRKIPPP